MSARQTPRERLIKLLEDPELSIEDVLRRFGRPPHEASVVLTKINLTDLEAIPEAEERIRRYAALFSACEKAKKKDTTTPGERAVEIMISDVEIERVTWLWDSRVALGKLTLLAGHPGVGKSLLATTLAAHVSAGKAWMDGSGTPPRGHVVILSSEDGISDAIKPRLVAAGCDPSKVGVLTMIRKTKEDGEQTDRAISLVHDLARIEEVMASHKDTKLLIVDPITSYLGGVDCHRDAEVRSVLAPLDALAKRTGVAVVMVAHLRKSGSEFALLAVGGSVAFGAVVRTGFLLGRDREDPDRLILACTKSNLAKSPPSLALHLEAGELAPRLVCDGVSDVEADDLTAAPPSGGGGAHESEAERFLVNLLADGPRPAREIFDAGAKAGLNKWAIKRAKTKLGVPSERGSRGWEWRLPEGHEEGHEEGQGSKGAREQGCAPLHPWPVTPGARVRAPSTQSVHSLAKCPDDPPQAEDWGEIEDAIPF